MNRGQGKTILFAILAVISIGALTTMILIVTGGTSVAEVPVEYEYIFAEETLGISDKIEATLNG